MSDRWPVSPVVACYRPLGYVSCIACVRSLGLIALDAIDAESRDLSIPPGPLPITMRPPWEQHGKVCITCSRPICPDGPWLGEFNRRRVLAPRAWTADWTLRPWVDARARTSTGEYPVFRSEGADKTSNRIGTDPWENPVIFRPGSVLWGFIAPCLSQGWRWRPVEVESPVLPMVRP